MDNEVRGGFFSGSLAYSSCVIVSLHCPWLNCSCVLVVVFIRPDIHCIQQFSAYSPLYFQKSSFTGLNFTHRYGNNCMTQKVVYVCASHNLTGFRKSWVSIGREGQERGHRYFCFKKCKIALKKCSSTTWYGISMLWYMDHDMSH